MGQANKITKEQFISEYCLGSEITIDFFNANLIAVECDCDYEECRGWAALVKRKDGKDG